MQSKHGLHNPEYVKEIDRIFADDADAGGYTKVMDVFVIERDQYGNMTRIIPCKQPVDLVKLAKGGCDE